VFDRGEPARLTFHIQPPTRADIGKPRVVDVMQPQPMP
jgi:hypothetical protein